MNKNGLNKTQNTTAAHRANLKKNLEHRLEVARSNGDETLVRMLEQEASALHLD